MNERRRMHDSLIMCYFDPTRERMGADQLLIDATSTDWFETIQKLHSFLSDRATAERKPGAQRQPAAEETTKSDNNLTRAWNTALGTIVSRINAEKHVTTATKFEENLTWTDPPRQQQQQQQQRGAQ